MIRKRLTKIGLPTVFVVIIPLILLGKTIFRGRALYWGLPAMQFVPWQAYAWEQLREGVIPLWNDLNGMGAPFLANYQLAVFYPPGWFLYGAALIGGVSLLAWANTVLVYFHLVWAGLGMIRLVQRIGGKPLAQTIAALAFSMSGFFVARLGFFSIIWTVSWMPWIVLFASRIATPLRNSEYSSRDGAISIPLIFCTAAMLLAGHAQMSWYISLYVISWVFVGAITNYGLREAAISMVRLGAAFFVSAILSAIQLLPTAEYLLLSQRTSAVDYETAMAYSFWPWRVITFLAPDFFGNPGLGNYWGYASFHEDAVYFGLLPFLLAAFSFVALFSRKKQSRLGGLMPLTRFLWGMIAIGVILALGKFTPVFPFLFKYVPTFDMFHGPVRIMIWVIFSLAILAAIACERLWQRPEGRGLYWTRLATAGAAAVTIGAFGGWYFLREVNLSFIQATAFAGLWGVGTGIFTLSVPLPDAERKRQFVWMLAVALWVSMDLLVAGWWSNPDIDLRFYAPQREESQLQDLAGGGRVYQSLSENYRLKFKRFVRMKNYLTVEPVSSMREIGMPNINLLDHISVANNFDPFSPQRYADWMDAIDSLPEEELAGWLSLMNVSVLERIEPDNPLGVEFISISPRERFELVECAFPVHSGEEAWKEVEKISGSTGEQSSYVVVETTDAIEPCGEKGNFEIFILQKTANSVKLSVDSDNGGWLVMRDVWYPGWRATVDDAQREIFKADYLFRAVPVPPGKHLVEFKYRPTSFIVGMFVSVAGFVGVFLLCIRKKKIGY